MGCEAVLWFCGLSSEYEDEWDFTTDNVGLLVEGNNTKCIDYSISIYNRVYTIIISLNIATSSDHWSPSRLCELP